MAAVPAVPTWKRMASRRSGRKNSGVMRSTASARSKAMPPSSRRSPTSTAMSAMAMVDPHSSTSEVWKAVPSTSMVASP